MLFITPIKIACVPALKFGTRYNHLPYGYMKCVLLSPPLRYNPPRNALLSQLFANYI